jgi:hypothetical protein
MANQRDGGGDDDDDDASSISFSFLASLKETDDRQGKTDREGIFQTTTPHPIP